ncbi:MAG: cytochrome c1 [Bauldia sp.]|nr:cytochrome c1 [Bauldia sp.]
MGLGLTGREAFGQEGDAEAVDPPPDIVVEREGEGEHAGEDDHGTPHYPLEKPERIAWSFDGIFGTYDAAQLQRGFQVYQSSCATCHGLGRVAFRTLAEPTGPYLSEEAMRAIAAAYQVPDDDTGELRPGRPSDYFPAIAPGAAGFAAVPPDLSLMAKARGVSPGFPGWLIDGIIPYQEGGADYIYSLLVGYHAPPEGEEAPPGLFYNPYFVSGAYIAMPPPLFDGAIPYADEAIPETVAQYAEDVAAFLMWTAEPKLTDRKRIGFQAMIFIAVFATLVFFTKRRVWRGVEH